MDGISSVLLKSIANEILKPLTLIINQSLETGIFPDPIKTSKVTPLYKKEIRLIYTIIDPFLFCLLYLKCSSGSFMYNCMTISVRTIYYASNSTDSGQNILRNSLLLNWWIS